MLISLDSTYTKKRLTFTTIVTQWFESSQDTKENKITITLETIVLPHSIR